MLIILNIMPLDCRNLIRKSVTGLASSLFLSVGLPVKEIPAMVHERDKPVCGDGAHAKSRPQRPKDQSVVFNTRDDLDALVNGLKEFATA